MKILLFLCCFHFFVHAKAQNMDFSGTWSGILTQSGSLLADIYEFSIELKQGENGNISGTSKIRINEQGDYGVLSLKVRADILSVSIYEIKVIEQDIHAGFYWCIKYYILRYNVVTEGFSGDWNTTSLDRRVELEVL